METSAQQPSLVFHPSPLGSVGIEIELPILDRDSGELVPGARRLLELCADENIAEVGAELMQSMIELRAGPCSTVTELRQRLLPPLHRVRTIARAHGYAFAMLGTHPFQRPTQHTVFPDTRFEEARNRLAWMIYYRVAFGLHVHVGVGGSDQAMGILNRAVTYLPHLMALSANSPFWHGVDTGLASCRAALYQLVPHAGIPPALGRWKDFRTFFQVMCDCGAATGLKDIKWDVRPRPDLGTLEFRICDMPHTLERVFAITAFVRNLTIALSRLLEVKPRARRADSRRQWITVENRWLAARYGLDAVFIRSPAGKRRPLLDDLAETIERLQPVAQESGDHAFLPRLRPGHKLESGAERQRQAYHETGDWTAMMQSLINRFNTELDAGMKSLAPPSPAPAPT